MYTFENIKSKKIIRCIEALPRRSGEVRDSISTFSSEQNGQLKSAIYKRNNKIMWNRLENARWKYQENKALQDSLIENQTPRKKIEQESEEQRTVR